MCGIAGVLQFSNDKFDLSSIAQKMGDSLSHRGPDDHGIWTDQSANVALSHRRLAIIDTSSAGHQPMVSACQRYVLVYNGEIYNSSELRTTLINSGGVFKGKSDTEVLLSGIAHWGLVQTIEKAIGMFAFAVWDKHKRSLFLVRDRMGIKPLYWSHGQNAFLFGSELKALLQHPECPKNINPDAAATFLRFGYIPAPETIFTDIQKLPPGTILEINTDGIREITPYWSLLTSYNMAQSKQSLLTDEEALTHLDSLITDSVQLRMLSDVPLGAFLSGGIDSSLVTAIMQKSSEIPVQTFSIGFVEDAYNEADHAREVARHLGTAHHEFLFTDQHALDLIPGLTEQFDEPFADSSQLPMTILSRLTKSQVTVALSGDGGDELFYGYNRYMTAERYAKLFRIIPAKLRAILSKTLRMLPESQWDMALKPMGLNTRLSGDRLYRLADVLSSDFNDFYKSLHSHWHHPGQAIPNTTDASIFTSKHKELSHLDFRERMMMYDMLQYLPDDILTKVDRTTMSASLEARVPLLDHRIVEFSLGLPHHMKFRDGQQKWLLRQLLYKHVPKRIIDRPKMGFGIPLDSWLRGPLRDWADSLLSSNNIQGQHLLNLQPIQDAWRDHISGKKNQQYALWNALILLSWLENFSRWQSPPIS